MEVYQVRQTRHIVNNILNYEFVVNPREFNELYIAKMAILDTKYETALGLNGRKQIDFIIQQHQINHIGRL